MSDGHITRLASYYYPSRTNATYTPLYQWLEAGGQPPACTVVSQQSWTIVGAQLFPASPQRIPAGRYRHWAKEQNVIYASSGQDPLLITNFPTKSSKAC